MSVLEAPMLTVRKLNVDLSRGFGRWWLGGDAWRTAFMNAFFRVRRALHSPPTVFRKQGNQLNARYRPLFL